METKNAFLEKCVLVENEFTNRNQKHKRDTRRMQRETKKVFK